MIYITDLERNDLDGALRYWRQERQRTSPRDERFEALVMLFDDPSEILAAMRREDREGKPLAP
jgi:hypothetical protein